MQLIETFLLGSSFKKLSKFGSHTREIEYYNYYAKYLDIKVIDYESSQFKTDFKILSKPLNKNKFLWSIDYNRQVSKCVNNKVDFIKSKQLYGSWLGFFLAKKLKSKFIIRIGYSYAQSKLFQSKIGKILFPIFRLIERLLIKNADAIIYGSEYLKEIYNCKNQKNIVVRNPVSESFFYLNQNNRTRTFVSVGRLIKSKGSLEIEIIDSYVKNGIIIGKNPDNINIKNSEYFEIVNNDKLPNILKKSKYYLSMSKTEGSPKAMLEAIFCGCIPVVSNIPAHKDIILDLGYGFLVDTFDCAITTIKSKKNNYCKYKHKIFVEKWSIKNVVYKEIEFLKNNFIIKNEKK